MGRSKNRDVLVSKRESGLARITGLAHGDVSSSVIRAAIRPGMRAAAVLRVGMARQISYGLEPS